MGSCYNGGGQQGAMHGLNVQQKVAYRMHEVQSGETSP